MNTLDGLSKDESELFIKKCISEERQRRELVTQDENIPFPKRRWNNIVSMLPYESYSFGVDNQCGIPRSEMILNGCGESDTHIPFGSIIALVKPNQLHRFSMYSGRNLYSVTIDANYSFVYVKYVNNKTIIYFQFYLGK